MELDQNLAISLITMASVIIAISFIPVSIIAILKTLNFKT